MEPKLHRGDLAVVRKQSVYRAGDVVLYDSRELGTKVLHRIVRVEGGRFVLKGDNNSFLDAEHPTEEQIVGSLWVSAPAVGRVDGMAARAAAQRPPRRSRHPDRPRRRARHRRRRSPRLPASHGRSRASRRSRVRHARVPEELKPLLIGLGVAAVACVGLAFVSFGRPLTATETVEAAYAHQGRFEYDARVPRSAAYPDGQVSTGEPVFQRLVHRLRVNFTYRLESELPVTADGRIALDARISDGRGWERILPLAAEQPFTRRRSDRLGRARPRAAAADHRRGPRSHRLRPDRVHRRGAAAVDVAGRVGGEKVDATFAPALSFDAGDLRLQPSLEGGEGVGPFAPREPGTGTRVVPAEVSLGALSLSVPTAGASRCSGSPRCSCSAGWRSQPDAARPRTATSTSGSRPATGTLLLPVSSRSGDWEHVIELADMAALVRLAEHQGKLILQLSEANERSYVVEDGSTAYRYRVHSPEPVDGDGLAARRPRPPRSVDEAGEARHATPRSERRVGSCWSRRSRRRTRCRRRAPSATSASITVDQKKPKPACNGITVTAIVTGGGERRQRRRARHRHRRGQHQPARQERQRLHRRRRRQRHAARRRRHRRLHRRPGHGHVPRQLRDPDPVARSIGRVARSDLIVDLGAIRRNVRTLLRRARGCGALGGRQGGRLRARRGRRRRPRRSGPVRPRSASRRCRKG